jgi:hypothetical protein
MMSARARQLSHRSRLALAPACLVAAALASAAPSRVAAQDPVGAVQGHFLASTAPDVGGALSADLWFPIGIFRIGGFLGVGAVPSPNDVYNRIFMPVGASVALEIAGDVVGVSLRARGGMWGGATQAVKITAGGFVGGGAWLLFHLSEAVSVSVGMDVWGLFGDGETALFAPGVGLTWTPIEGS